MSKNASITLFLDDKMDKMDYCENFTQAISVYNIFLEVVSTSFQFQLLSSLFKVSTTKKINEEDKA